MDKRSPIGVNITRPFQSIGHTLVTVTRWMTWTRWTKYIYSRTNGFATRDNLNFLNTSTRSGGFLKVKLDAAEGRRADFDRKRLKRTQRPLEMTSKWRKFW